MIVTDSKTASKTMSRTAVLLILTLVYIFNFLDRQIIGIVAPFIQADLGFSDSQMGWLMGLAFAALYCTVAIPIALLADRFNRVRIVSISLAVWSGFTVLTGMAQTFIQMLLARVGVGIGEAGGSPPSHSIISDLYIKEERASALGIYSLGIPLGVMMAYFITGTLLGMEGVSWRVVLIVLGVPGVLLAIFMFLRVPEPSRGATDGTAANPQAVIKGEFGNNIRALLKIKSWWFMCLAVSFVSFGGYALSNWGIVYIGRWKPELMEPENFRTLMYAFGVLNALAYGPGTYFGAKLADRLGKKNVSAYGWLPGLALVIGVPALIYAFYVDSIVVHLLLIALYTLTAGFYLGPAFALAQTLAPIKVRAMSTALFFFILNMIALGGGPTIVGLISQALTPEHGAEQALRLAMTFLVVPFALSILFFFVTARTLPKDWREAERRNAAAV
ncbi:MAG: MFS transporter [Pseudomonadota bacterium]